MVREQEALILDPEPQRPDEALQSVDRCIRRTVANLLGTSRTDSQVYVHAAPATSPRGPDHNPEPTRALRFTCFGPEVANAAETVLKALKSEAGVTSFSWTVEGATEKQW